MTETDASPEILLERARTGDQIAQGHLLDLYRNYLRFLARSLIGGALRTKLEPSDIVQETYLKAHREFEQFRGGGEPELVAWLRQILVRSLADQVKHHRAQGRDHRREQSLEVILDHSSLAIHRALAVSTSTPSGHAVRREQAVILADALARLPQDYREVFVLRNLEHIPIEQIAERMGRSPNAVRKLWSRAILTLGHELEAS